MEASAERRSTHSGNVRARGGIERLANSSHLGVSHSLTGGRKSSLKPIGSLCENEEKLKILEKRFWSAWNTHKEYLKKLSIVWMNVSVSDAEDAFSEATIRAFEKYRVSTMEISNERAWFARLLHNICIDRHRANKRQKKLRDTIQEIDSMFYPTMENLILTPEAEFINGQLKSDIKQAIDGLPDRLKRPLVMRLIQEEDYDDIARELDISNDNARKRVQQARAYLRSCLAHHKR